MYHSSNRMYHSCFTVLCRFMVWLWNLKFMLQNEGLDEKKKQYATCALDSTSPKEGEGGGRLTGGICVGCEPICHFFKSIYILGQQFFTAVSDSRKALLVLLCKLECFAVCLGFKLCLAIIYKLKGGKRGENFGNIASISQTHLFHKFYKFTSIFHFLHTLLAALPSQWLFIGL